MQFIHEKVLKPYHSQTLSYTLAVGTLEVSTMGAQKLLLIQAGSLEVAVTGRDAALLGIWEDEYKLSGRLWGVWRA